MNNENPVKKIIPLALTLMIGALGVANANTVENLERERSVAIQLILDADVNPQTRFQRMGVTQRRLADLERAVLHDKSLSNNSSPRIRRSLESFDLTFLVHAAAEKNKTLPAHWLDSVGLTSSEVLTTSVSR